MQRTQDNVHEALTSRQEKGWHPFDRVACPRPCWRKQPSLGKGRRKEISNLDTNFSADCQQNILARQPRRPSVCKALQPAKSSHIKRRIGSTKTLQNHASIK
ncbi:MAG: hypothetical protein C0613_07305 [Desulfobulbaceae bacterium]|nr:MAG: hypothetical protein C0613_07305 [Desulfobulbaceae bacterium]